jgi:hypothetical protein
MRTLLPWPTLALVLAAACGPTARPVTSPTPTPTPTPTPGASGADIPLRAGTVWVYASQTEKYDPDHPELPIEESTTVRSEVTRAVTRGELTAALVTNVPGYGDETLIINQGRRYWFVNADAKVRARLDDAADTLADLVGADPDLSFPFTEGKLSCDDEESANPPMYCTMVEAAGDDGPDLSKTRGLPPGPHAQFMIVYRTNPDDTETFILPGVGITGYGYHHHGTPNSVDMVLTEVQIPR